MLCEDSQHEAFLRRFFKQEGWSKRLFRVEKSPQGRGSGEMYVRNRYPKELVEYRRKKGSGNQALAVMIDGDDKGYTQRLKQLCEACKKDDVSPKESGESVLILVPTWNIETWLTYLNGENVDESIRNYPRLKRASACLPQIRSLLKMCADGNLREPTPESLLTACRDYRTFKS